VGRGSGRDPSLGLPGTAPIVFANPVVVAGPAQRRPELCCAARKAATASSRLNRRARGRLCTYIRDGSAPAASSAAFHEPNKRSRAHTLQGTRVLPSASRGTLAAHSRYLAWVGDSSCGKLARNDLTARSAPSLVKRGPCASSRRLVGSAAGAPSSTLNASLHDPHARRSCAVVGAPRPAGEPTRHPLYCAADGTATPSSRAQAASASRIAARRPSD
jgi:hypothetical protein